MKLILTAIFIFHFSLSVSAQNKAELHGIVLSAHSQEVLAGASITIYNKNNISGVIANKEGRFLIAPGTDFDSVKVSMVGYRSKTFAANGFDTTLHLEVRLDIAPAALQEVVVKPLSALEIIKKAIAKIPVNQPKEDFENKGFYREIIKDNGNYFSVAEAIFTAQYFPSKKDYKLKLEQGRSKEDVSYTRLFEDFHPGGGPQGIAGNSFITGTPEFLTLKDVKNFNYKVDSMVQFDGQWLYHISFDQKPGVKESLDKGYVLIDADEDAVVQYDVQNSPLGTPYMKSLTGSDKLFAQLLKIDFKRKGWKRHVDFTRVKDKWIMSYAETEYTIAYKQPKKQLDLDLTISIDLAFTDLYRTIDQEITKGEEWKKNNIVANLPTAFDSSFWGNNNIISPTEQVKDIIAGISKNSQHLPASAGIAGWQYMNRNRFVSYSRNDTITLIPVMKCNWEDNLTGGLLYRDTDSDFVMESKINVAKNSDAAEEPDRGFQQAGIIVRSSNDTTENYVFLSVGTGGNRTPKLFFKRTIANKSKTVVDKKETMNGWMRIEKSGKRVVAYFKDDNDSEYKKVGEYDLDWLKGRLQVGFAVFATFPGDGPKMKPDIRAGFSQIKIEAL